VSKIEFMDDDTLQVRTNIEMGYMNLEVPVPAVLAVSGDINVVRLPTMFGALWATEKTATVWTCEDLSADSNACGLAGSPTWVPSLTTIEMKRRGDVLRGDPNEVARQLIQKLRVDGVLPEIQ
jgi:electron transfer flavoprotein beta subunit